jgi:DNA-binding transcriptional regulator YhcF (GntR family)
LCLRSPHGSAPHDGGHLLITIDNSTGDPPYEQIRTQIAAQVASGELPPGTKLPTVRALAEALGIAPNTVARAYRELEYSGVVSTRGRNGTVVHGDGSDRAAKEAAASYADAMRALGVRQDEALELVRRAFDRPVSS